MKRFLIPALLLACAVGTARAGSVIGSVGFGDTGTTTDVVDLNSATTFTLHNFFSDSTGGSGIFASYGGESFGTTSFSLGSPRQFFNFCPDFRYLTSASITEADQFSPGIVARSYVLGIAPAGSIDPATVPTRRPSRSRSIRIPFIRSNFGLSDVSVPPANMPGVPGAVERLSSGHQRRRWVPLLFLHQQSRQRSCLTPGFSTFVARVHSYDFGRDPSLSTGSCVSGTCDRRCLRYHWTGRPVCLTGSSMLRSYKSRVSVDAGRRVKGI